MLNLYEIFHVIWNHINNLDPPPALPLHWKTRLWSFITQVYGFGVYALDNVECVKLLDIIYGINLIVGLNTWGHFGLHVNFA